MNVAIPTPAAFAAPSEEAVVYDFDAVYAQHAPFVWRTMRALGVPAAAIDDAIQDLFVVVHQKLPAFHGPAKLETWLFEIARRIASHYRRAAGRDGRSEPIEETSAVSDAGSFEEAARKESAALVIELLGELDDAKRELLVLVELEQVPVPEVAAYLKVPLNTAYSRLRLARRAFAAALDRRRTGGGR